MSKYTPGPWEAGEGKLDGGYLGVFRKDGMEVICRVSPLEAMTEGDVHNAFLIAAAPEMRETLEKNLRDMDRVDEVCRMAGVHPFTQMRTDIEAAVTKANGKEATR